MSTPVYYGLSHYFLIVGKLNIYVALVWFPACELRPRNAVNSHVGREFTAYRRTRGKKSYFPS